MKARLGIFWEEVTKGEKGGCKETGHNNVTWNRPHGEQTQEGQVLKRKAEAVDWRSY